MAEKISFTTSLPGYRARAGRFDVLEIPDTRYLMCDGHGDPNTAPAYADALAALYPVAYRLKFASKRELGRDYVMPPLEGLWWAEDVTVFTSRRDASAWDWTMMLMVPEWLGDDQVEAAVEQVRSSKTVPARLGDVRVETLREGTCVQTLHLGPFIEEGPVLERLHHEVIPEAGLTMTGRHHEIYLSDPRRIAPERLRTILRQPVTRVSDYPPPG